MNLHRLALTLSLLPMSQAFADLPDRENALKLPDVLISANRQIEQRDDSTAANTVFTRDDIERLQPTSVTDLLNRVPGVQVAPSGGRGSLPGIYIRGTKAAQSLVLVDGQRIANATSGDSALQFLDVEQIERVEVLRGSRSVIYGADAIGGVINMITGDDTSPKARIEYGSLNTKFAEASIGTKFSKGHLLGAISAFSTDGVDTSGNDLGKDGTDQYSGLFTGAFELSETWLLSGLLGYSNSDAEYDSDTDYDGLLNDVDLSSETEQLLLGAALSGQAFGLDHQFRITHTTIERDNFLSDTLTDASEGKRTKISYSPSYETKAAFAELVRLTGILEYEKEDYSTSDIQYGGLTNQDKSFETLGIGGEALIDWGALTTYATLRFDDNYGQFDDAVSGRIVAAYQTEAYGRFRASVGTGSKNPTFTELFGFFPGSFIGNPNLKTETSAGWELGWDKQFDQFGFGRQFVHG